MTTTVTPTDLPVRPVSLASALLADLSAWWRGRAGSRVLAIRCRDCGIYHKPRHIRIPGHVCRDCETTTAFQQWNPRLRVVSRRAAAGGRP